jgi:predicted secreted hydrolase
MKRREAGKRWWGHALGGGVLWLLILGGGTIGGSGGMAPPRPLSDVPWKKALPPFKFEFPRDHASHPDYKMEWWYYTGNLKTREGRRFGYQLTFFRVGVKYAPVNPSRWAVRDLYTAHFAISDLDGKRFRHAEKLNRAGVGWGGAEQGQYRVWNEDWEARLAPDGQQHLLQAKEKGMGLSLSLNPLKPPVTQGENGVSQKGKAPGNGSHYYSLTRLATQGVLQIDGESFEVEGMSWMDHEFGTSFLESEQKGWDWFSIQLENGEELMLYQFRRTDGARDPHSNGVWVGREGKTRRLRAEEFRLTPLRYWRSKASGAVYPVEWQILLPTLGWKLIARAAFDTQELQTNESTRVTYWEGAIVIEGDRKGRGYLEMTGYAGAAMGAFQ